MKPKNFKQFLNEEQSFDQKMRQDGDFLDIVASVINATLESLPTKEDCVDFREFLNEHAHIDATNLLGLTLSQEIDLCIFAEDFDFQPCPETKWEYLEGAIGDNAISAFGIYFDEMSSEVCTRVDAFMKEHGLSLKFAYWQDPYSFSDPNKMTDVDYGSIYHYGRFNMYVFMDNFSGSNITIYFKDAVGEDSRKFGI